MFFIDLSPFILVSLSSILFAKSKEKEETQEQEENLLTPLQNRQKETKN